MGSDHPRLPRHSTVVAYIALFVAIGGSAYAAATIGSNDIESNAIKSRHIAPGQVKKGDFRTVKETISFPALNAGQCAFVEQDIPGVPFNKGVVAITGGGWDNRLMVAGVEASGGSSVEGAALQICNHTPGTNLDAGSGAVRFLIF